MGVTPGCMNGVVPICCLQRCLGEMNPACRGCSVFSDEYLPLVRTQRWHRTILSRLPDSASLGGGTVVSPCWLPMRVPPSIGGLLSGIAHCHPRCRPM